MCIRDSYEAEMAVVIGKRAENVTLDEAHEYIFGVTAGNDVSERAWQSGDIQWVRAKGSKGFNAVGPELVRGADYNNLQITGRHNGEVVQGQNSSDMIFGMEEMVSYISQYFVLEPGDYFGEMGLLGNAPRNATITAADDTKLLELTKADLAELSEEHPGLFKELELSVSNRSLD